MPSIEFERRVAFPLDVVGGERRPERTAGIARRRLDPDIAEAAFA